MLGSRANYPCLFKILNKQWKVYSLPNRVDSHLSSVPRFFTKRCCKET
jgi:hypothetical protein